MLIARKALRFGSQTERGRGLIGSLCMLAATLIGGFVVWSSLEVAYRYYDLRNQVAYLLRSAEVTPELEIKKRAVALIKGAGISAQEQDIVLQKSEGQVRVAVPYTHEINLSLAGKRVKLIAIPLTVSVERRLAQGQAGAGTAERRTQACLLVGNMTV